MKDLSKLIEMLGKASNKTDKAEKLADKAIGEIADIMFKYAEEEKDAKIALVYTIILNERLLYNALKTWLETSVVALPKRGEKPDCVPQELADKIYETSRKARTARVSKFMKRASRLCQLSLEEGFEDFKEGYIGDDD